MLIAKVEKKQSPTQKKKFFYFVWGKKPLRIVRRKAVGKRANESRNKTNTKLCLSK